MRHARLDALAGLLVLLASSRAYADCPVVETYTGPRPDQADERLRPMFDVFEERGCLVGRALTEAIAKQSRASLSVSKAELQNLGTNIDNAVNRLRKEDRLLSTEDFDQAKDELMQAIEVARGATAVLASDLSARTTALRAYVGLAMTYKRWGERLQRAKDRDGAARKFADAEKWMAEGVRSFPGMEPERFRGREAFDWWDDVRKRQSTSPTGELVVDPGEEGISVFVAGGYMGRGLTTKTGLAPGVYDVYTERLAAAGRVHSVEVRAGEVARLMLDWNFDAALHTGSAVWFKYDSPVDHGERRGPDAGRIATMLEERYAIVIGLASRNEGNYVFGLVVSSSGRVVDNAKVDLDDSSRVEEALRNLAVFLSTRAASAEEVPIPRGAARLDATSAPEPFQPTLPGSRSEPRVDTNSSGTAGRVLAWTSAVGATAALGAGLTFVMLDDDCLADERGPCSHVRRTKTKGLIGLSTGVALSATTGYLMARFGPQAPHVLQPWRWLIGGASVAALAAGTGLIAIHQSECWSYDGDMCNLGPRYRPTLVPGSVVVSVGAVGLGASLWLFLGEEPVVQPMITTSQDGATLGVMGRF